MKVVCPECALEFTVPVEELGPRGRRVRCSGCGHIWLQEPERENAFGGFRRFEDDDMDIEPIPPSVHPDAGSDDDDDDGESGPGFFSTINYPYLARMLVGFALAVLLAGGGIYALAQKGMVPRFLEPLAVVMGMPAPAPAGDFRIDGMAVQESKDGTGADVTLVTGQVLNVSGAVRATPQLDVIPVETDGTEGEGVRITPKGGNIDPGKSAGFSARLQGKLPAGSKIYIRIRD